MLRSRILACLALLTLGLAASSCATRQPVEGQEVDPQRLDRKLSTFAYIEQGKIATLIVGVRVARDRDGYPYMPLEIAVANNGLRKLTLTRESFTLIDEQNNRYPAANPRELIESYEHLDFDRELAELQGIIFNKFAAYARYPSNFSPTVSARNVEVVRDLVSLPKFGYMLDFIYFPTPPGGIHGQRFDLFMDSPDLEEPIFVKFMVN